MLKNSLTDIAAIVFLRDDKLLYRLIFEEEYSDIRKNDIGNLIDNFYPNSFRKPAIEYAVEYIHDVSTDKINLNYNLNFLEKFFEEFFEIDGNHIYAKKEKLEEYNAFINKVHPFNMIGFYLAKKLKEKFINEYTILEFVRNITPLAFEVPNNYKNYVDNHIHAGGSINDFASLIDFFSDKKIKDLKLPYISEFNFINSNRLNFEGLSRVFKLVIRNIMYRVFGLSLKETIYFSDVYENQFYNNIFSIDKFVSMLEIANIENNILLQEMLFNYKKKRYYKFGFLFNVLMFYCFLERKDIIFDRSVKIFLHISNIFRSYILMSQNIGLTSFSEFNRSSFKKRYNTLPHIAETIILSGTTSFEIKFSTSDDKNQLRKNIINIKKIFDEEIIRNITEHIENKFETKYLNSNKSPIKYHFCLHFKREKDKKEKNSSFIRFYKLRRKLKKEAIVIDNLLKEQMIMKKSDFYNEYFEKELENQYIDLSKLITTIDVAGDENRTPPEVFAPVIKFLRRDFKVVNEFKFRILENLKGNRFLENYRLKLSVHAGEDFNHIVTGMRRIDEVIEFYKMKRLDRIAHALAIGINPKLWVYRNRDIVLTKEEYLDNLVWMYFKAVEISDKVFIANKLKEKFLEKIKKLSLEIYGKDYDCDNDYDVYDLYEAWKLREFCPIYFNSSMESEYTRAVNNGIKNFKNKKAKEIFIRYQRDYEVFEKGNKVMKIDNLDEEEFEFYEALQDYMIEKITQKGIYIETNSTSNIYIGYFEKYKEHPIFRWYPINEEELKGGAKFNKFNIRDSVAKVCVNTDDPMIMPTTLYNEYLLLIEAAKKHSKNIERINKWIEDIRKNGEEIFNNTHQYYEYIKV